MRKPRDFDSELKALNDKATQLKDRKVQQLGELVIACRADALPVEQLAGALLAAAESNDRATKEGWHKRGAAFFQHARGKPAGEARANAKSGSPSERDTPSAAGGTGAS